MTEPTGNHRRPLLRFPLGRMVITATAVQQLANLNVLAALARHVRGDWGDVDDEDWEANERALVEGTRLLSVYRSAGGVKFWVITERDHSVTTGGLLEEWNFTS